MIKQYKPTITVFHCINAFTEGAGFSLTGSGDEYRIKIVRLPCSGMVKDVVLLRAFEAGSDGVAVLVCPERQCRHVEGSLRARKRVKWVQNLLDEIGIGGGRLAIFNISEDKSEVQRIIRETVDLLHDLGPALPE
jgi:F420-non-reducing hydrogenase iron-sulfur subunit